MTQTNWIWNANGWMYEFCTELQGAKDRPDVIRCPIMSESQQCGGVTHAECQKLGVNATQYVFEQTKNLQNWASWNYNVVGIGYRVHGRTEELLFHKQMKLDYPASSCTS